MNEIRLPQKGGPARAEWAAAVAAEVNRHGRLLEAAPAGDPANRRRARRPPNPRPWDWAAAGEAAGLPRVGFAPDWVLSGGALRSLGGTGTSYATLPAATGRSLVSLAAVWVLAGDPESGPPLLASCSLEAAALPDGWLPLALNAYSATGDTVRTPLYVFRADAGSVWCECDLRRGVPALALPVAAASTDFSAAGGPVFRLLHAAPGFPPSEHSYSQIPVTRYEE